MLRPRNRDQDPNAGSGAAIQKPARRRVIDPHQINSQLRHQVQIPLELLPGTEIVTFRIRTKWPVGDAFDEKFALALKEEFGHGADARRLSIHRGTNLGTLGAGVQIRCHAVVAPHTRLGIERRATASLHFSERRPNHPGSAVEVRRSMCC